MSCKLSVRTSTPGRASSTDFTAAGRGRDYNGPGTRTFCTGKEVRMRLVAFPAALILARPLFPAAGGDTIAIDNAGKIWRTGEASTVIPTATAFQKTAVSSVCAAENLSPLVTASGAGVSIAVSSSQQVFLAVSPAPLTGSTSASQPPFRPLGKMYFLELSADTGRGARDCRRWAHRIAARVHDCEAVSQGMCRMRFSIFSSGSV
jgi:hypothetical protein